MSYNGSPALREGRGPKPECSTYICYNHKRTTVSILGYTADIKRRVSQHNHGQVQSTKLRQPLDLLYYESYNSELKARDREIKLKYFGSAYHALIKRLGLNDNWVRTKVVGE